MPTLTLKIDNQGRVMLPSWWRKDAGVGPSTELLVAVDESGALVLETRAQGLRRARALVRKYIPANRVLSDELVRERRKEAAREEGR
jgi:bifunctional DNA-binding transcriptional regulator/antitoxin component of YhaV-PrlF toxin-antitoxin module